MPCIACKEEIKQDALKCPHCQQVQTKSANLINTPHGNLALMLMLAGFIIWIIYGLYALTVDEELQNQLQISTGQVKILNKNKVSCFAEVTNTSTVRWENFSLQAEFFDQKKQLLDIHYDKLETTSIYPGFDFTARVTGTLNDLADNYESCKISLLDANSY